MSHTRMILEKVRQASDKIIERAGYSDGIKASVDRCGSIVLTIKKICVSSSAVLEIRNEIEALQGFPAYLNMTGRTVVVMSDGFKSVVRRTYECRVKKALCNMSRKAGESCRVNCEVGEWDIELAGYNSALVVSKDLDFNVPITFLDFDDLARIVGEYMLTGHVLWYFD